MSLGLHKDPEYNRPGTPELKVTPKKISAQTLRETLMATLEETEFEPEMEEKVDKSDLESQSEPKDAKNNSLQEREDEHSDPEENLKDLLEEAPEDLEDVDDEDGPVDPRPPHLRPTRADHVKREASQGDKDTTFDEYSGSKPSTSGREGPAPPLPLPRMGSQGETEEEEDDDIDVPEPSFEGAYDPAEYENLTSDPETRELFAYITRYTPQTIELEHRLRPFIPDYIPAVGDIDAFIKIPRPDGKASTLGLAVLDEPSARQSDPTVLDLQLRALAKHTTAKSMVVKKIENAEKSGKVIEKWVRDISDLHRAKPPPTVHYTKRMPDIDLLMQEWPGEVEDILKEVGLPTAALDTELHHYVDIICALLDIPVYKNRIQSLHVLFTLYSIFKNSSHFQRLAEENMTENEQSERVIF